jgi:predicted aconitase/predicted aconitase with swiveling domain
MSLKLTPHDQEMLAGRHGEAVRMAMSILVQMAEVEGAAELMDVARAHIDGALYMGESSLEFAETFARLGGRVAIPTTMNIGPMDEHGWRGYPVPEGFAEKGARIMRAYIEMGCQPTWSCAPYQAGVRPAFGEQIAWAESNAIVFANSVLGARTNRYGDYVDLCAALTGRVPRSGLHLAENRRGRILFRLTSLPPSLMRDDSFYPVLGYYLGERAGQRIPVLEGLPRDVTEDQLKALGAAAASSGSVALFHAVGITPEAPTVEAAFQGRAPEETVEVTPADLRTVRQKLTTSSGERLDVVALGCPHFSPEEFARLARLVEGKERHPAVEVVVTTSRFVRDLVQKNPYWPGLERFGVRVVVDSCILHMPVLRPGARVLMTNSGKHAHYIPGLLERQVVFGSLADCVRSAVLGRVVREEGPWAGGHGPMGRLGDGTTEDGETRGHGDAGKAGAVVGAGVSAGPPVPPGLSTRPSAPRMQDSALRAGPHPDPLPEGEGGFLTPRPRSSVLTLRGRPVVAGSAEGVALVAEGPLSFWGGLDAATGEVIDRRHHLSGQIVTGRVLVMPYSRGSSTTSTVLLEAIRAGTAPAAIVASCADPVLALGSIVGGELYHRRVPVVALEESDYRSLRTGHRVAVRSDGMVEVLSREP